MKAARVLRFGPSNELTIDGRVRAAHQQSGIDSGSVGRSDRSLHHAAKPTIARYIPGCLLRDRIPWVCRGPDDDGSQRWSSQDLVDSR